MGELILASIKSPSSQNSQKKRRKILQMQVVLWMHKDGGVVRGCYDGVNVFLSG